MRSNFVFDTNTLISAALSPFSKNAEAIEKAERLGTIVYSEFTWREFQNVLFRPKFDKYIPVSSRETMAKHFLNRYEKIEVDIVIRECRDQRMICSLNWRFPVMLPASFPEIWTYFF